MDINGRHYRTIWLAEDGWGVEIIDQTKLPYAFETLTLWSMEEAAVAIRDMWVRGAPLIGATAAYGMALAMRQDPSDENLKAAYDHLLATRPTAVNLRWALDRMRGKLRYLSPREREDFSYREAGLICDEDVMISEGIGRAGLEVIRGIAKTKKAGEPVNVLTHCNAGWLATVDWGTATAPIYMAHEEGINVHVWVDETRPRNQGASLTAYELGHHGIDHTLIVDNAGGHLMQHGQVDLCIVGTDRTTARGDVCNKIGTYLKALAAHDNGVPFYVALPSTTIDWTVMDGVKEIPIEERGPEEVTHLTGLTQDNRVETILITPPTTKAGNPAFDVTPARYVSGLFTERGLVAADEAALAEAFPDLSAV